MSALAPTPSAFLYWVGNCFADHDHVHGTREILAERILMDVRLELHADRVTNLEAG